MKKLSLVIAILMVVVTGAITSLAANPKSKKPNTRLYEEESGSTVSGKVKAVREIQEETEVFLDSKTGGGGPFVLPLNIKNRAAALKALTNSQKPGGSPVTLRLDDQQRILGVEETVSAPESESLSAEKYGL